MSGHAERMHELLIDVVATAVTWERVSDVLGELAEAGLPGIEAGALVYAESQAHESLVRAILAYAHEYEGFASLLSALESDEWGRCPVRRVMGRTGLAVPCIRTWDLSRS